MLLGPARSRGRGGWAWCWGCGWGWVRKWIQEQHCALAVLSGALLVPLVATGHLSHALGVEPSGSCSDPAPPGQPGIILFKIY